MRCAVEREASGFKVGQGAPGPVPDPNRVVGLRDDLTGEGSQVVEPLIFRELGEQRPFVLRSVGNAKELVVECEDCRASELRQPRGYRPFTFSTLNVDQVESSRGWKSRPAVDGPWGFKRRSKAQTSPSMVTGC